MLNILKASSLNFGKGCSNAQEFFFNLKGDSSSCEKFQLGEEFNTKLLGLYWYAKGDVLSYCIKENQNQIFSKRTLLVTS